MSDEIFDEHRTVLFFGTERDLEDLTGLVQNCLTVLREATKLREMVIETWLAVDYSVRMFLLSGFELGRFCDEGFDLQYKLLPRDFGALLGLLEYSVKFNAALPLDPEPAKPDKVGGFTASTEFWRFVRERFPELREHIKEVERQYSVAKNPGCFSSDTDLSNVFFFKTTDFSPRIERMKLEWRQAACALDSPGSPAQSNSTRLETSQPTLTERRRLPKRWACQDRTFQR
jgi:hypothetical protein